MYVCVESLKGTQTYVSKIARLCNVISGVTGLGLTACVAVHAASMMPSTITFNNV